MASKRLHDDPEENLGPLPGQRPKSSYDSRKLQCMSAESDMSFQENSNRRVYTKKTSEAAFVALEDLRRENQLCDVVIRVGESEFPAHRVVLAATSPYFRGMFTGDLSESRQDVVELRDQDPPAVDQLIKFMYTGTVEVAESNVQQLLPAANMLQLVEVRDACCDFLKQQLDPSNCLGFMRFADLHSCRELLAESQLYAQKNFPQVRESEEFISLSHRDICDLISSNELGVVNEKEVYEAVMSWVKYDIENRSQYLTTLLEHVRYESISSDYVLKNICDDQLLNSLPQCKDFIIKALKFHLTPLQERSGLNYAPSARARAGILRSIIVVGGQAPKAVKSVEVYDVKTHRCGPAPDLLQRRCRCGITVLNGDVYAVGGFDGTSRVRLVERLDLEKGVWVQVPAMMSRRSTLGVATLNSCIYAVGGFDGTNGLDSVEKYDPLAQEWCSVAPMKTRRSSVGVAALDGLLYAVGGYDGVTRQCLNSVECYNPDTDQWKLVEPMTQRRSGAAVAVLNGNLFAIGGHEGPDIRKSVEWYNPRTRSWQRVADMCTLRRNAAAVVVQNLLYVLGGDDGTSNLKSIEVFDLRDETWTTAEGNLTVGRSYAGTAALECPAQSIPSGLTES